MIVPLANRCIVSLSMCVLVLSLVGCGTATQRVDATNDPDAAVSYGMDYEDWREKASELTQSLLDSGALTRVEDPPAVIAMDLFRNKSGEQLDMNRLTDTMRVALNRTGQAQASYRYNLGGNSEAIVATGIDQEKEFFEDKPQDAAPTNVPDFTLSGVVTKDYVRQDRTRQVTYIIKLSLAKTGSGTFVWEDQAVVRKRGTKAAVGF